MYDFILNPVAGKGKTILSMKKIESFLNDKGIEYKIHSTLYPFHATEIATKLSLEGSKNIIAVGGDGTVNEVLNGIKDLENCNLGIIPCGTGNDFAKFIKLPKNPVEAIQLILNSSPKNTDFMLLEDKRVLNVTGMGMDVTVLERCKKMKFLKGKFQYIISLLIVLLNFKWHKFFVSIDDKPEVQKTVLMIAACNGKFFGGGMPISPNSYIDDNFMNVIIINKLKKWKIPLALINLYLGKILKYDFVENILCQKITIRPENNNNAVNIDGELIKQIPFNCTLIKNQLKLYR